MNKPQPKSRNTRNAALVIIATMILWLVAQWAGAQLGLAARYVFLVDFAALAGFLWALIVFGLDWLRKAGD